MSRFSWVRWLSALMACASLFMVGSAQASSVTAGEDESAEGPRLNPFECYGRYESATGNRTMAQVRIELEKKFDQLSDEEPSSVRAMKGGAVDFLEKPVEDTELLEAIERALVRYRERQAARREKQTLEARAARLTPREREVFALVAAGLLNKQVGHELGTTEKTIKVHRARVMEKMEADSLADLVRMAASLGLSSPARRSSSP